MAHVVRMVRTERVVKQGVQLGVFLINCDY